MEESLKNALSKIYNQNKEIIERLVNMEATIETLQPLDQEEPVDEEKDDLFDAEEESSEQDDDADYDGPRTITTKQEVKKEKEQEAVAQIAKEEKKKGLTSIVTDAVVGLIPKRGRPKKVKDAEVE